MGGKRKNLERGMGVYVEGDVGGVLERVSGYCERREEGVWGGVWWWYGGSSGVGRVILGGVGRRLNVRRRFWLWLGECTVG